MPPPLTEAVRLADEPVSVGVIDSVELLSTVVPDVGETVSEAVELTVSVAVAIVDGSVNVTVPAELGAVKLIVAAVSLVHVMLLIVPLDAWNESARATRALSDFHAVRVPVIVTLVVELGETEPEVIANDPESVAQSEAICSPAESLRLFGS